MAMTSLIWCATYAAASLPSIRALGRAMMDESVNSPLLASMGFTFLNPIIRPVVGKIHMQISVNSPNFVRDRPDYPHLWGRRFRLPSFARRLCGVQSPQMGVHQGHRQSHNVEVAPVDALDKLRSQPLNAVPPGLVHGLAAGHVFLDVGRRHGSK